MDTLLKKSEIREFFDYEQSFHLHYIHCKKHKELRKSSAAILGVYAIAVVAIGKRVKDVMDIINLSPLYHLEKPYTAKYVNEAITERLQKFREHKNGV